MNHESVDPKGLIRESYNIEGITIGECRSIFLDWAIQVPVDADPKQAIEVLLGHYGPQNGQHPMTTVMTDGLGTSAAPKRRGGRKARVAG